MAHSPIGIVLWSGQIGGAETLATALAAQFMSMGQPTRVYFLTHAVPLNRRLDIYGVPHETVGLTAGKKVILRGKRFVNAVTEAGCKRIIVPSGGYLAASIRLWGYRGAVVAQDHGSLLNLDHYSRGSSTVARIGRWMDPFSLDAQVAVSDFMREAIERGPHARRLVVIPNGVDTQRFAPTKPLSVSGEPLRVHAAARLVPGKGLETLIEAVAYAVGRGEHLTCCIAGSGELEDTLRNLIVARGLEEMVSLPGRVEDMPAFWNRADVCVVPSDDLVESFGLTAAEAMACGRPVVASDAGGLKEIVVDRVSGYRVRPGDPLALAGRLSDYARDRSLLARHGSTARSFAESQLSIDVCAQRYLALLDCI